MVSLNFLEKVEIFKNLDDTQLTAVQECCTEAEYKRDDIVFTTSEDPLFLWIVQEGTVDLRQDNPGPLEKNENTISSISEAMTFGWSSLVPPFRYRLSAYCASRSCNVIKIDKDCLLKIFEKDAKLGYEVMSEIVSVIGARFHNLREGMIKNLGEDIINKW